MPRSSSRFRPLVLLALVALLFSAVASPVTAAPKPKPSPVGSTPRVVMFASDGMRPDLMEKYAKAGFMPTYRQLMKKGVTGRNGMTQAFPPNTGVGWYTMATGAYPADHGSTNNTYFRAGDTFRTGRRSRLRHVAGGHDRRRRRASGQEGRPDRLGRRRGRDHPGPDRRLHQLLHQPRRPRRPADPVEAAGSAFFGVNYEDATLAAATGWTSVPAGDPAATPQQTTWSVPTSVFGCGVATPPATCTNLNRTYNVYFYDSVTGGGVAFDHAIVSPVGKTGAAPSVDLAIGDFEAHPA